MSVGGQRIIDGIIDREKGYVDHPDDSGGPTKYGITLETLREVRRNPHLTADDVKALTVTEARQIYQARYIDRPGFFRINAFPLQELVVDCGVNHGPYRPSVWLQKAVGFPKRMIDGKVGRITAEAVNTRNPKHVFADVLSMRNSFFEDLDDNNPSQESFQDGWVEHRVNHFIRVLARWEEHE